jgi:hypothetical protein
VRIEHLGLSSAWLDSLGYFNQTERDKTMNNQFGTIIQGTMRAEDLIPAFCDALDEIEQGNAVAAEARAITDFDSDTAWEMVHELGDELNGHALPFSYFGAHVGDGADYGFWPDIESLEDSAMQEPDCVLRVDDTGDVPSAFRGYVMHVNDHGNVTLYCAQGRDLTEIWACV